MKKLTVTLHLTSPHQSVATGATVGGEGCIDLADTSSKDLLHPSEWACGRGTAPIRRSVNEGESVQVKFKMLPK